MNSPLSSDLPQQNGKTMSFETNLNPRFQKVSALHSKSRNHTSQFIDKEVHLDGAPQSSYPVDETAFRFRVHQWCLLEIHSHHRGLRMRCVYLKVIPSRGSFHTIMYLRAVFKGEREAWNMHLEGVAPPASWKFLFFRAYTHTETKLEKRALKSLFHSWINP